MMLKRPGFTAIAIITLALGIGANTAIFSIVNGVLLRSLPYKEVDRIVTVWATDTKTGKNEEGASPANILDWRDQNQVFERMGIAEPYSHRLTGNAEPESIRSWLVSEGLFEILGVNALYGRTFLPEEYQAGNDRVVVIGEALWRQRFGGNPDLVGQTLLLSGQPHTVVGIMPAEFEFPSGRMMWAPLVIRDSYKRDRRSAYIKVIARLKPGVTLDQAQQEMTAIHARLSEQYPKDNQDRGVAVIPLAEQMRAQARPALLLLLGAAGFVLLIACANVANLLLARGAERQKEFAIRAALGAARSRLIRQLITESVTLGLLGGTGGILAAWWCIDLILAFSPASLPRTKINFDGRVLLFSLVVSLLTAFIFSLAPSLQFSRPELQASLKEGGRSGGDGSFRRRLRNVLVVSEIALALTLLIGAGLLVRSFVHILRVDPGFSAGNAISLEVHIWGTGGRTPSARASFIEQTLDHIAELPGVEAAGAVSALPFHDNSIDITGAFTIDGRPTQELENSAYLTIVTGDYFTAMGIPLRSGRQFTRFDRDGAQPVVLIGETMARRFWPDEDPVGKRIKLGFLGQPKIREIIGVVGDARHTGLDSNPRTEIFLPHLQEPYGSMTYVVRPRGQSAAPLQEIKSEVWALNKDLPFSSIATLDELVSRSLGERRFNLLLLGSFSLIALTLASIGIYGLMSFSISRRTHEFGVRMALGAQTGDVINLVLREGMVLTVIGVTVGLTASIALTRLLSNLLFGVTATDPATFIVIPLVLAGVALAACLVPARRATRVDPMIALRYE
jgi:putative ABC transport system permease protein